MEITLYMDRRTIFHLRHKSLRERTMTTTASASTDAAACQEDQQQQQQQQQPVVAESTTTSASNVNNEQQAAAPPPPAPESSSSSSSPTTPIRRGYGADDNGGIVVKQQKRQRHPFMPFSAQNHHQQQLLLSVLSPNRINQNSTAAATATATLPPPVLVRRHSSVDQSTTTSTTAASSSITSFIRKAAARGRGAGGGRPWTKALQRVLHNSTGNRFTRQSKQKSALQELQSTPDPLGNALTKILNQNIAFNGGDIGSGARKNEASLSSSSSEYHQHQQHFSYPPLLSRHNFIVAKTRLQATWQLSWRQLWTQCWQGFLQRSSSLLLLSRKEERRGLFSTFQAVFLLQVILILVLCLILLVVLLWSAQCVVYTSTTLLTLLIDVQDVEIYFLYYTADLCRDTWQLLLWIDCYILRGIRFQGREWNCHAFQMAVKDTNNDTSMAVLSSESTTLWELPPPTVQVELENGEITTTRLCCADGNDWMKQQLLLQQQLGGGGGRVHNNNDNNNNGTTAAATTTTVAWSADTLDHVVAIDFCCLMLQDSRLAEKRERKEKRQQLQQKKNKKQQQQHQQRHHLLNASELKLPQLDEGQDDENDDDDDYVDGYFEEKRRRRIRARSDSAFLAGPTAALSQEASNAVVIIRQVSSADNHQHHSVGGGNASNVGDDNELVTVTSPVEAIELKVCSQDEDGERRYQQQQKRRWRQRQKRHNQQQQQKHNDPPAAVGGEYSWPDDEHTVDNDDNNTNSINTSGILSDDDDEDGHNQVNSHNNVPEDNADDSVSFRGMTTPNRRGRGGGARGGVNNNDEYDDDQYSDDPFSIGSDDFSPCSSHHGDGGGGRRTRASSMSSSEAAGDRPWLDVGAEIGLKLLNSAHVHRAVASQETTERIIMGAMETTSSLMREKSALSAALAADNTTAASAGNHYQNAKGTSETSGPGATASAQVMLAKPVHPMWTSPGAAMLSAFRDYDTGSDYSSSAPPYSAFGSPPVSPRFSLPSLPSTPQQQQQQQQPRTPKHASAAAGSTLTPKSQTDEKARPPLSPHMSSPGVIRRVLRRRPSQENELIQKQRITLQQQQQPVSPVPSISAWPTWSPSDQKRHHLTMQGPSSPKTEAEEAKTAGSMRTPMGTLTAISPRLDVGGPFFSDDYDTHPLLRLDQPQQSRCVIIPPTTPREPLAPGVKVAVPILPNQPTFTFSFYTRRCVSSLVYQMGTVVSSQRIFVGEKNGIMATSSAGNENDDIGTAGVPAHETHHQKTNNTNCLSVTVKLEKSFLRNGEFANLTFRVMDCWSDRFMPKHSKVPIGACVATSFGIGVLVGWRVEDDCHVVRSLWQRRGTGAASGYLSRNSIHGVVEAAVGFRVQTTFGWGETTAYVGGGPTFENGHYFVAMKQENRHKGCVIEVNRKDILSCHGAQFIPVIEYIREAAHFQIQLDTYQAALREQEALRKDDSDSAWTDSVWKMWSEGAEILWTSFLKAVEEDKEFDDGVNSFMMSIIDFLERLDGDTPADEPPRKQEGKPSSDVVVHSDFEVECVASGHGLPITVEEGQEPAFWIMNDFLGGIFNPPPDSRNKSTSPTRVVEPIAFEQRAEVDTDPTIYYDRAFAVLRTLMKTVSIARASSVDNPDLRLGLAICYDCLVFVRTIVKVLRKNESRHSMEVWNRALDEIASTFGPMKERLEKIGQGIAQRMEKQGRRAKIRVLNFVDTLLGDERLILALEQGDWEGALVRLELALIKAKIIEKENLIYYRKAAAFIYSHLRLAVSSDGGAATRNNQKLAVLAKAVQWIASPRRSILKIFERNDVLDFFERILVRVFHKEEVASRMLVIHASNFHSLRHLRLLKDVSTSGRLWMPVLDAADEEFSWVVSHLPENTKELISPLANLFSLCVAEFHSIETGDRSSDWMDFLLADEAVQIIHNIDMKLILALEAFSRDVKEMMLVLPYYSSIDDDILNLMDEVDLDQFLKEASDAMDDHEKLAQFVRAKVTFAIERFLNYLPRMSIPVEKRDLVEGWVLTCRGEDGGDLTLSDVTVKRENLVCQIMGGDVLYFPMFGDDATDSLSVGSSVTSPPSPRSQNVVEESVLDHIREMLLEAQRNGCWKPGVGGIGQPPSDRYVATALHGLPVSAVLNCGIELWRNLEIDDDELLEIAIRDVSFQIRLQKEREEAMSEGRAVYDFGEPFTELSHGRTDSSLDQKVKEGLSSSFDNIRRRFNPRVDPTVLFLEMRNLTLQLDKFLFRIEKNEKRTILDPVFEGKGTLTIKNVSIRLRIECAKERAQRSSGDMDAFVPVLLLRELTISVENVWLKVKDTGFGSDWLLNKAVDAFADDITKVVEDNLRDQIQEQARKALDSLNSYFLVNPNMLLNLLGISMDDLENNVVWV